MATQLAVEGMYITDGQECLLADTPHLFAAKTLKLYTDCQLWDTLAAKAHWNIEKHFSVPVVGQMMLAAVQSAGLSIARTKC